MNSAEAFRRGQLLEQAAYRDELRAKPVLRWLFFEMTDRCNLACRHCGSGCTQANRTALNISDAMRVIDRAAERYSPDTFMVCLTGGEPLLHSDFFSFAAYVRDAGIVWGMTTNATLIDDACALRLRKCGMRTVSVSLDGDREAHDRLRGRKGAYDEAVRGIRSLQRAGLPVQVTSVIHSGNFDRLEEMYRQMRELGVDSWRPINIDPIGRANAHPDLMLTPAQIARLLRFIQEKRFAGGEMEVTYGCSHYLTPALEHMVRGFYFMCRAGLQVASVTAGGDLIGCLDIERRPELVQGNIATDDFADVWENRYQIYRSDRTAACADCAGCAERAVCGGDSMHTWDFDRQRPILCLKNAIEEGTRDDG